MKMKELKAPERVLKTIDHEEPDKVPAFESDFTNNTIMKHYGIPTEDPQAKIVNFFRFIPFKNLLMRKILKKRNILRLVYLNLYELYRRAHLDIVHSITTHFPRKVIKGGFIDEFGRIMKFVKYKKDGTSILYYYGGIFKDFETYENWKQPDPNNEVRLNGFLAGRDVQKEKKDEIFSIPATGALMEATWEGWGLESFSKLLVKRKQAKKVFDDHGKFTLELVKILAENDAQLILLWDDYGYKSGLFMSPKNYREYVFPWIKRICDVAHKLDCKIFLHSDGDIMEIFEDIVNCGVDAINPIEPTTANPDYDIFKLNEKYGDKITFCGNLSPQLLATGEISEIENYAKKLIREIAPGGGYIFSSGHSINPAITVDRFLAMQNIKEKYGIYPINVPN